MTAAAGILAALFLFATTPAGAIDPSGVPLTRLDEIRVEAAELKQKADGASPAELRKLDARAKELLREVGKKYPQLMPKSAVRRGRVVRVKENPRARFGKAKTMKKPAAGPVAMVKPRLRVSKLSVKPDAGGKVEPGKKITLTFTIRNDGTGPAKKGSTDFLVTCDMTSASGECPFPEKTKVKLWQDIPAGGSASNSRTAKKGAVTGTYSLGASPAGPMAGGGMSQEVTVKHSRSRSPVQRQATEEPQPPPRRRVLTPAPQ